MDDKPPPLAAPYPHDLWTEAEARVLICPVLTPREAGASPVHCAGSRCMAWRPLRVSAAESRGYCGLAGTPAGIMGQLQGDVMHNALRTVFQIPPNG